MIATSSLSEIKNSVISKLNTDFSSIHIIDGFSHEQFFGSADSIILSVKICSVKTSPTSFDDFLGGGISGDIWQDLHGELAEIKLSFTLFIPLCDNTTSPNNIFEQLCYSLRELTCADFSEFSSSELEFSEKTQAFTTRFTTTCHSLLVENKESIVLKDIVVNAQY